LFDIVGAHKPFDGKWPRIEGMLQDHRLASDKDCILAVVERRGYDALPYASDDLKAGKDVVLETVKKMAMHLRTPPTRSKPIEKWSWKLLSRNSVT